MFRNYLKIAWRNTCRNKVSTSINVVGLAVGLVFCTFIFLYVRDELTYDRFHTRGDRIYRVIDTSYNPDGTVSDQQMDVHPIPLGGVLKAEIPGIERYVRLHRMNCYVRTTEEAHEVNVQFVDPSLLQTFTFPLIEGNPETALARTDQAVITRTVARRFFGDQDPVGKTIQVRLEGKYEDFVVSALAEDIPGNSTLVFDVLLPFDRLFAFHPGFRGRADSWDFYSLILYVELAPGVDPNRTNALMPALYARHRAEDIKQSIQDGTWKKGQVGTYLLEPLLDVHLSTFSKPVYSFVLSGIALAVLLIACINFMTLSIGHAARRATEVGIRKVVGAGRMQLAVQFWGEAVVQSALALLLALVMAYTFLPLFNRLSGKTLHLNLLHDSLLLGSLLALVLATGLVAGSYPALVLSGFRPIETLANRLRIKGSNVFTRSLVVVQFGLSVFFIASTMVMTRQLDFVRTMNPGFDRDYVLLVPTAGVDGWKLMGAFRNELRSDPHIIGLTASNWQLGQQGMMGTGVVYEGQPVSIAVSSVESNYLRFLGIDLVAGRDFDPRLSTDTTRSILVNEALVRRLHLVDPVGKTIPGQWHEPGHEPPTIVGVVRDHHFQSLYQEVKPMMYTLQHWPCRYLMVRIRPDHVPEAIEHVRETWNALVPDLPFTYQFLDDDMRAQYENDERWNAIVRYSALFAVFIAGLGLLGLASLSVSRRTKEIGIRKVLGATISRIVVLISKDFVALVVVGIVLAVPAAWYAMFRWLENFAYRIDLSVLLFAAAGLMAMAVALIMVGFQVVRAAAADPVKALRYE